MKMRHGNLVHLRLLEVMELRQVLLMMGALVGVVKHVDGQPIQRAHMIRLEMDYLEQ